MIKKHDEFISNQQRSSSRTEIERMRERVFFTLKIKMQKKKQNPYRESMYEKNGAMLERRKGKSFFVVLNIWYKSY